MTDTNLQPFVEGVFTTGPEGVRLVGSRCPQCGRHAFPARDYCPDDQAETERAELVSPATLYSHTTVRTKPPFGLPAPYSVGYVDLTACGLRIFMLLDPAPSQPWQIGMPLELRAGELGVNLAGEPCQRPYFTATGAKG